MILAGTRAELEAAVGAAKGSVAFVPTMGNLHAGHLQLVNKARSLADQVVVSVFVNPLQFGPGEDFAAYPRTFDADRAALEAAGVSALFAPTVEEMYPDGPDGVAGISVPHDLAGDLEGRSRPGHFDGVATAVHRLFTLVKPDIAVFGEKDFQQLLVIRWLVQRFDLPVQIVGEPTVREPDGLAMSSRNQYLTTDERARAPAIHRVLKHCVQRIRDGETDYISLAYAASAELEGAGLSPDYVAVRHADDLSAAQEGVPLVVLAAARLGKARLIDNLRV